MLPHVLFRRRRAHALSHNTGLLTALASCGAKQHRQARLTKVVLSQRRPFCHSWGSALQDAGHHIHQPPLGRNVQRRLRGQHQGDSSLRPALCTVHTW